MQVKSICQLYLSAQELLEKGIHLISTDEMTSIQANERICPNQPIEPGRVERNEARVHSPWHSMSTGQLAYCQRTNHYRFFKFFSSKWQSLCYTYFKWVELSCRRF
ncbi:MAG: hypothetical protein QNJ74_08465 [Trichodesmium sp. MO_231.B1]|nr:hypothetical protein [Trichodesmium sp. MO_231.B1]